MVLLEICIDSRDGLDAAVAGKAGRLEVCARLDAGGLTPSDELLRAAIASGIPCIAMIRPRGGDFVYSRIEKAQMLAAIELVKPLGVAGIVTGALTSSSEVDRDYMTAVVSIARPSSVTFHRAFDLARDAHAALETLVELHVDRVLTSGGAADAHAGRLSLRDLVTRARGRITILAGGGVRAHNALEIVRASGVTELHSSTVFDAP